MFKEGVSEGCRAVSGRSVADSLFRPHPEQRARASREPSESARRPELLQSESARLAELLPSESARVSVVAVIVVAREESRLCRQTFRSKRSSVIYLALRVLMNNAYFT